jgi:hypothetical protein
MDATSFMTHFAGVAVCLREISLLLVEQLQVQTSTREVGDECA